MYGESQAELIVRLRNRDPGSLEVIYDTYGALVYSLCFRITHDSAISEELTHEVFFRLWTSGHRFDPVTGSLAGWLSASARHIAMEPVDSLRERLSLRARVTDAAVFYVCPETNALEKSRALAAALTVLPAQERNVLELLYFDGFSQSEIAIKLDLSLATVKDLTRSALSRLRSAT